MKKIIVALIATLSSLIAMAQVEHSIILEQSTFRKVNADPLTGVNIDPIAKDLSRNACARVKIKFANMSRAEIDALSVKFQSNTDLARQQVAQYFDNVLILEMTAKANTRFYVQSPEYGQSNEVTMNLEGNCEYEMEARLNQSFSIIVGTNAAGADIYIDGIKKAKTDANKRATIKEVMVGEHTLKLVYNGISAEQKIVANGDNISFNIGVNTAVLKPQYVVFNVEPKNTVVTIDGQIYTAEDGVVVTLLNSGNHTFKAEARGYHPQSGTFTVEGAKIERTINLKGDYANVTIKAENGADIYVNDKKIGTTSWSGRLNSGLYLFEARKVGYHTQSLTQQITSDNPQQSYTLPALTPIDDNADIGELVTINGVQGIVFQISPVVKIVSVKETTAKWGESGVTTNATNTYNGKANMNKIKAISGWETKYPAFKWCADLGDGWYLPALNELRAIYNQRKAINKTLSANNMDELDSKDNCLWSSYEDSSDYAYFNYILDGYNISYDKECNNAVRAVYVLDGGTSTSTSASKKIDNFDMVFVAGGIFTMGATAEQGSDAECDEIRHSVVVSDFYIGKYEVTQAQWRAVMGSNPSKFTGDNNPVEMVSLFDVKEFIKKLNAQTGKRFRLPTEAEWEYAARGGNKSKGYKYSGSDNIDEVAWYRENSNRTTHPVGQKTPNELGIYDMSGNVGEWCQEWKDSYSNSLQINPIGPSCGYYSVLRGGGWWDSARYCRVSYRGGSIDSDHSDDFGFRLVLEPQNE